MEDTKRLKAFKYYKDYVKKKRSLSDIADKISIGIYELVDIYGDMELPLIVGDINDYDAELKELDKVLK